MFHGARLARLEARLLRLLEEVADVDRRFAAHKERMDRKLAEIEKRLDRIEGIR